MPPAGPHGYNQGWSSDLPDVLTTLRQTVRWMVAAALFAMMVITCVDVVGRYVVNRPFPGSAELVQYLMVTTIFVALPVVTLRGEHISISLIESALGPDGKRLQRSLVCFTSSLIVGMLCHRFWVHAQMLAENRDVIGFLNLPVAPAAYLASVFSGLTSLVLIAMALAELSGNGSLGAQDQDQGGGKLE